MPGLARIEIWSDLAFAGGTRLAVIPEISDAIETQRLEGDDALAISMRRESDAWAQVREHRVVRVVYDDDTWSEWRIGKTDQLREDGLTASLPCLPPLFDLARGGLIERTETDGTVSPEFDLLGLTPSTLVSNPILTAAPSYFSLGTVDPTAVVDLPFRFDTALSALRELAKLTGCELDVRRDDAASKYKVDILNQIGAAAATITVRTARNMIGVRRLTETDQQATRIYGKGGGEDGFRLTLGQNYWKITAIAGSDVTLADPSGGPAPIGFDDQLNGLYLRKEGAGSGTLINDSAVATQKATLASVAGLAVNNLVRITKNSAGDELTYLEMPTDKALYGTLLGILDRSDIPPVRNLVANPQLNGTYSSSLPASWSKVGTPTTSEETNALYARRGGKSCKVVATIDGQGIECSAIVLIPTASKPYFSAFVTLQIASGRVRVEVVDVTNGVSYPDGKTGKAWSNQSNVWTDLGVEGLDLNAVTCVSAKLRIVADSGAATFYVDSAQLTQTAGQEPFYAGNGANALWQAVNAELLDRSAPQVTIDLSLIDLNRLDAATFPYDQVVKGGLVRAYDEDLGIDVTTRIVSVERNLRRPGETKVQLTNRPDYLTDILVRPRRRSRLASSADTPILLDVLAHFDDIPNQPGKAVVTLASTIPGASIYYILQDRGDTVPVIGRVGGSGEFALYAGTFQIDRQTEDRQLSAYAQLGTRFALIRTWIVDQDSVPTATVAITEPTGGTANVATSIDDDVAFYLLYRGKNLGGNGWPTIGNTITGALDESKKVGTIWVTADGGAVNRDGTPLTGMAGGTGVGGLIWQETGYVNTDVIKMLLVPVDRNGNVGARASASRTMSGAASPRITAFSIAAGTGGTSCAVQDRFDVTYGTAGASAVAHDLLIYRSINSGGWEAVTTIADPTTGSPYADTTPGFFGEIPAKGGVPTSVKYKAELVDVSMNILDVAESNTITLDAVRCS